ncbi:MAG: hypothetical protein ACFFHD_15590, partial [Promethearchaeota archaeon]
DTNNINEAYYLSAILNSNLFTKQIKIMKSSRHIFKLPFEIPVKKFKSSSSNHQKLVELGKKGEEITKDVIKEIDTKEKLKISKPKIQNILSKKLKFIFKQIDDILTQELNLEL